MGLLVDGKWVDQWYDTKNSNGEFIRQDAQFRDTIAANSAFPPESGRYHLFVSLACPWAHRTLMMLKLKKLEHVIGVTAVKPEMLENGWEIQGAVGDLYEASPVPGIRYMHELYTHMDPHYNGRVTVPVLWDKHSNKIVNNESSEIIRILNTGFNDFTDVNTDYYPPHLQQKINDINEPIYHDINNGVYKVGFATTQAVYEKHYHTLFKRLDSIETLLSSNRYLTGDTLTEADLRLFTTLIRFDSVYFSHFKCNQRQIESYEHISNYVREIYQLDGIAETVNFDHIKTHYYFSHATINPTGIVPLGPDIDYSSPHNRHKH